MNPRILLVVAACAIAAVCAFLFTSRDAHRSSATATDEPPSAVHGSEHNGSSVTEASFGVSSPGAGKSAAGAGKVDWDFLTTLDLSKASRRPTAEDIARFLAKYGETPANLVAVFEGTNDRRYLNRALELFPGSPLVLMKAIDATDNKASSKEGQPYQINEERLALIERFKTADPNNPVPWIFAAQELFRAKQTAEGAAEIRASLERPAFYIYANERMEAAQQFKQNLGYGPLESTTLATFGLTLPHMSAAQQASRGLMEWQKSAAESGDAASSSEALRLTYELGRTFATPEASRLLIGQLVGLSMEKRALDTLPADAQPNWLTIDRTQRLAEIEKEKKLISEVTETSEWVMKSRDEQILTEWLSRLRNESEKAALEWAKAQRK